MVGDRVSGNRNRQVSALGIVVALLVGALVVAGVVRFSESPASAARAQKHTICHRTRATGNPYRLITVSRNAIFNPGNHSFKNNSGHGSQHPGAIFDAGKTYGPGEFWGDIIPSYLYSQGNRTAESAKLNWSGSHNQDLTPVFSPPGTCSAMTTKQFMTIQNAAGASVEEIMDDLEEQGAVEDLSVKAALGGSFSGWYDSQVSAGQTPSISDATSAVEAAEPSVATKPAGDLAATTATLRAEVDPQGAQMSFYFQLDTVSANVSGSSALTSLMTIDGNSTSSSNSSSPVQVELPVSGLQAATTYYFRIVGEVTTIDSENQELVAQYFGEILDFQVGVPSVTTNVESNVGRTSAILNGEAMPNGQSHSYSFEYSTDSTFQTAVSVTAQADIYIDGTQTDTSSASSPISVTASAQSLTPATTYFYRIKSSGATSLTGSTESFTTLENPTGQTSAATNVSQTSATLNGSVSPNGSLTNLYFQWATSAGAVASAPTVNAGMTIGGSSATTSASNSTLNVSMPITGLTAGTQYHYRLIGFLASDNSQVFVGSDENFRTSNNNNGNNGNNNPGPPVAPPSSGPSTTVKTQGPPAKVVNPGGGGGNGGGGNGGPPVTDPRTGGSEPIEEKVIVQVGPTLPAGGGGGGGGGGGSIRIAPQPNEPPLELLDATIEDPEYEIEVVRSGTDYNKPETWEKDGFGDECWKFEPGGSSYVLPDPPVAPSGKAGAVYSAVKVKAGSLTSDDPNFQVNTLFLEPAPGSMVWPDSNKDGVYNPGGRTGDKEISHVIVCVRFGTPSSPSTTAPGTTAAPTTSPSTSAPSTTAGPTTTAAPATTTVAPPAIPTTSVPEETPEIEIAVRKIQSNPEDPTTTTTAPSGPRERKISLTVTNGFKQSKLEIVVDLDGFIMTDGNVPLPQLPKTGDDTNRPLQLAVAALAIGAALVLVRRRLRLN
jgi:LPXTG-motif cell wall-anchored protein